MYSNNIIVSFSGGGQTNFSHSGSIFFFSLSISFILCMPHYWHNDIYCLYCVFTKRLTIMDIWRLTQCAGYFSPIFHCSPSVARTHLHQPSQAVFLLILLTSFSVHIVRLLFSFFIFCFVSFFFLFFCFVLFAFISSFAIVSDWSTVNIKYTFLAVRGDKKANAVETSCVRGRVRKMHGIWLRTHTHTHRLTKRQTMERKKNKNEKNQRKGKKSKR